MRSNAPVESPRNYYLRNLYYPFLDGVIVQLDQRFFLVMLKLLYDWVRYSQPMLLLPIFVTLNQQSICFFPYYRRQWQKSKLSSYCGKDLVKMILMFWLGKVVIWKRAYKLYQTHIFLAIKILLSILATFSVSSSTADRLSSTLRLIKSDLRTTMGQARLNGLCLIYIHNDISISSGAIIKKYAVTGRKIKL